MSPQAPARPRRRPLPAAVPALVDLLQYRWSVPVLGAFHAAGGGARFAGLMRRLGVGRGSLARTLEHLVARGWIEPNPGYGHPLRPEYRWTPAGRPLAAWCARLHARLERSGLTDDALRKWPLPVVLVLAGGPERFGALKAGLPGITARALTLALERLEQAGLVRRRVEPGRPPRVTYLLERRGRALAPFLADLPS